MHPASSSPVVSLQPTSAQSCSWAREGFTSLSSHKLLIRTIIYRAWQGCVSHFILKQVSLFPWYKGGKWFSERLRGLFRQGQGVIPSQTHQTHSWQKRPSSVWWEQTHKALAGPYTALWEAIAACYWLHVSKARTESLSPNWRRGQCWEIERFWGEGILAIIHEAWSSCWVSRDSGGPVTHSSSFQCENTTWPTKGCKVVL